MLMVTIPYVMNFSSGEKLLDMMPTGYSADYVSNLFYLLGESGRHAYLFYQLPVDMVYPILFAIGYCLVLAFFLKKINKFESIFYYLCFVPIFSGIFDYCENVGIILMLKFYPNYPNLLVGVTSIFSTLKSIFTTIYFVTLIIVVCVYLSQIRKSK